GRGAGIDDEVRVPLAHHRAAHGATLQAGGLDEPAGMVHRRIAENRTGVGQRQRLLRHTLVGHLLDAAHGVRPITDAAAKSRPDADHRRALQRARPIGVAKLVGAAAPAVAVQVHELGVDEGVGGLAAERAGVAVHGATDGPRDGRHPLQTLDAGASCARGNVGELGPGGRLDDLAVDGCIAPCVLHDATADPAIRNGEIRAAAEYEHRQLVFARDGDRSGEVLLARDTNEEVRGSADPQRSVRREKLTAQPERGDGHTAARARSSSSSRSPAGRMSPAPRMSTRSPGRTRSASRRAAASAVSAYEAPARAASARAPARSSALSRAEANDANAFAAAVAGTPHASAAARAPAAFRALCTPKSLSAMVTGGPNGPERSNDTPCGLCTTSTTRYVASCASPYVATERPGSPRRAVSARRAAPASSAQAASVPPGTTRAAKFANAVSTSARVGKT